MHALSASFVLGYHGCDRGVAERLLGGENFKLSSNDYDWLGPGIYFWEANPQRGLDFARELAVLKRDKGRIRKAGVVGAVIELGLCLAQPGSSRFAPPTSASLKSTKRRSFPCRKTAPLVCGEIWIVQSSGRYTTYVVTRTSRPSTRSKEYSSKGSRSTPIPAFMRRRMFKSACAIRNVSRVSFASLTASLPEAMSRNEVVVARGFLGSSHCSVDGLAPGIRTPIERLAHRLWRHLNQKLLKRKCAPRRRDLGNAHAKAVSPVREPDFHRHAFSVHD